MARPAQDLTGQMFGRLTVIQPDGRIGTHAAWKCKCQCGSVTRVRSNSLRSGKTKSCGCLHIEVSHDLATERFTTHGKYDTPVYRTWLAMKGRCLRSTHTAYPDYGGRGIGICDRWKESFENFHADMGDPPGPGYSIERNDVNGNYEPGNCKWATVREQRRNTRSTVRLTYNGVTKSLAEWAEETGLHRTTIATRLRKLKWSVARALGKE